MSKYLEREHVCEVLYKKGLLSLEQVHNITLKDEKDQLRLRTHRRQKGHENALHGEPTIIDLLAALRLQLPDDSGDILSEEMVMRALAEHWRLPFYKIDPLKLNTDIVTSVLPLPQHWLFRPHGGV